MFPLHMNRRHRSLKAHKLSIIKTLNTLRWKDLIRMDNQFPCHLNLYVTIYLYCLTFELSMSGNKSNSWTFFFFFLLFRGFLKFTTWIVENWQYQLVKTESNRQQRWRKLLLILQRHCCLLEKDMGNSLVKRASKSRPDYPAFDLVTFSTALVLQDISLAETPENIFGTSGLQNAVYFVLCSPSRLTFHKWKSSTWENIFPSCLLFGICLKEKFQVANEVTKAFFGVLALWEVYKSDLFKRSIPLRNRKKTSFKVHSLKEAICHPFKSS